ncbi:hypothetical protein RND81_06G006600 [Saponaria officinalis]|uniref:Mechanosensitive ion channel protein 2, chloroplastic-like n=1 Tax=Saponaria officinalis TaxID=3572 RepID=A0AAW1K673_SAPOF
MAVSGSLQLSSFLGFCGNQERFNQLKYVAGRGNQHCLSAKLSSCASRQDLWSHRLSSSVNRPLCSLPHRYNLIRCNSFLFFGQNVTIPTVNSATAALARSCTSVNPLVTKLVPPVCIVIFALWGLQPLMQLSRRIFVHKTESTWKKSTTNYVMTSYLQPVLLWTAAILVCRTLDPIAMPTESSQLVKQRLLNFVKSLSTVLAFAFCLSSVIQQTQKYFTETNNPSDSRNMGFQFAGKAIYSAVWVAAVSLFMELLGFSTQKWLTAGGLGTVLLTLAGREIFTNFLSSIMIHATRPFVVNEWIQTKIDGYEVSGTVEHVGWWSPTIIRGDDREAVHIPNHKFTVNVVRNLTQKTHWRIKTHLAISHLDASKISSIVADMRKVLAKNPQVEQQRLHRRVFLDNVDPENQALLILISCFVKTSHHEEYLCVKEAIMLDLLRVVKHHRARLATPIRTIQKFYNEPDLGNMSFSDSFYNRGGPAAKSPVLLIEPPYKINGEDKSKSQGRAGGVHTRDMSENPGVEQPMADSKDKGSSSPDVNAKETSKPGNKAEVEAAEPSNLKTSDEQKASVASKSDPKPDDKANAVKSTSIPTSNLDNKSGDVLTNTENTQTKINAETTKPASKALEDNIVLGVALEGSKRTLPIEDDLASSATPQDPKELAKQGNGNGNSSGEKDEKDN